MRTFEEVVQIIEALNECDEDGFWDTDGTIGGGIHCYLNVNDVFYWGTGDQEELTVEDIPAFLQAHQEVSHSYDGTVLFVARKRKIRPQGAWYYKKDQHFIDLLHMCGPFRPADILNPVEVQ